MNGPINRYDADARLSKQSLDVRIAFATRCALRAFPSVMVASPEEIDSVLLPSFRALLTSSVTVGVTTDSHLARFVGDQAIPFSSVDAAQIALFDARQNIRTRAALSATLSVQSALAAGYSDSSVRDARGASARSVLETPGGQIAARGDLEALEASGPAVRIFDQPLWSDGAASAETAQLIDHLEASGGAWRFWHKWYRGMYLGRPLDWALQHSVLLIWDEVWASGARPVAEKIRAIEERQKRAPLAVEVVRRRVDLLLEQALATEMTASGLANQIEEVISSCLNDLQANCLPDEFATLERMPQVLRRIAVTVARPPDDRTHEELEAELQHLAAEVESLQRELAEAKAKCVSGRLSRAMLDQTGKSLGDWKMWGAISGSMFVFFGDAAVAQGIDQLAGSVRELFGNPSP